MIKTFRSKIKGFLKPLFCIFLAFVMVSPTYAISEDLLDFYNLNGIYYYDPTGSNSRCASGEVSLSGSTAAEKIWSGLTSFMTPEQAAGVMGNMVGESGLNPVRHEGSQKDKYWGSIDLVNDQDKAYGIGLIQWSYGRRVNLLRNIQGQDASLLQYFNDPDQYNVSSGDAFLEKVGDAVFDRLVQIELEFLKEEINTSYKGILDQTTIPDATKYFMDRVERPTVAICYLGMKTCDHPPEYYKDGYESSLNLRTSRAQNFFDDYNGATLSSSTNIAGTNVSGSDITIIGDSITEGSKSQIESLLPGVEIDSEVGRQFNTGIEIAKSIELRRVVVFALGTNNTGLTQSQVDEVVNVVGPDRNLYFVTNYYSMDDDRYDYSHNNQLLTEAAGKYSNVVTIEWDRSASTDPSKYISSDGIHPTTAGKELFAKLIYNAVTSSNLTSDGCMVSGDLQQLALRYAWPTYHAANYFDMMPDYEAAVQRRRSEGKYVGGASRPGIDCGGFVTTLIQDSGFAPEYNGYNSNVPPQEKWVKENGWTLLNGTEDTQIDTGILQPGDVAFSGPSDHPGHTFIYVGQISGFDSNIASASYGGSSDTPAWRTPMAGKENLLTGKGVPVRWYRKN